MEVLSLARPTALWRTLYGSDYEDDADTFG